MAVTVAWETLDPDLSDTVPEKLPAACPRSAGEKQSAMAHGITREKILFSDVWFIVSTPSNLWLPQRPAGRAFEKQRIAKPCDAQAPCPIGTGRDFVCRGFDYAP